MEQEQRADGPPDYGLWTKPINLSNITFELEQERLSKSVEGPGGYEVWERKGEEGTISGHDPTKIGSRGSRGEEGG